jgi:L-2,4-diaminobutyrate decarboxylase
LRHAEAVLLRDYALLTSCYSGAEAADLAEELGGLEVCPEEGRGLESTLNLVGSAILRHSVVVSDPACVGHLHCPPLIPALAAESLISATNQSMDSWDQAPAATYLEQRVIDWLGGALELGSQADGIFTSGGTQSNLLGLLLSRDDFIQRRLGWCSQETGFLLTLGKCASWPPPMPISRFSNRPPFWDWGKTPWYRWQQSARSHGCGGCRAFP